MTIDAVYTDAVLPEWRGNPLIEALPPKKDFAQILPKLSVFPPHGAEERIQPGYIREDYLSRLDQLRLPLPEYRDCFRYVQKALFESYSAKNPFSPTTNHFLHYISPEKTAAVPSSGVFEPNATAMTVVGISGVGKSKMLTQVLGYFPQVIRHKQYKEKALNLKQLVWVRVDCPSNSTVKGLCHAILAQIDLALGEPRTAPQATLDALMVQIEHRIRSVFLGALAVDELQHIDVAKSGGAEAVISFLLNLINRSGVPVIFCGNPEMLRWIQQKFRLARRAEAGGYIGMGPIKQTIWPALMNAMWPLQWTNVETALSDELSEKLYELSAGIPGIAIRIYKEAQDLVIGSGDERINVDVLEDAFTRSCILTGAELVDLRENRHTMFNADYDSRNREGQQAPSGTAASNGMPEPKKRTKRSSTISRDLTRPHHPEFEDRIRALQASVDLAGEIENPNVLRRAGDLGDVVEILRDAEIVMEDPLLTLGGP